MTSLAAKPDDGADSASAKTPVGARHAGDGADTAMLNVALSFAHRMRDALAELEQQKQLLYERVLELEKENRGAGLHLYTVR